MELSLVQKFNEGGWAAVRHSRSAVAPCEAPINWWLIHSVGGTAKMAKLAAAKMALANGLTIHVKPDFFADCGRNSVAGQTEVDARIVTAHMR